MPWILSKSLQRILELQGLKHSLRSSKANPEQMQHLSYPNTPVLTILHQFEVSASVTTENHIAFSITFWNLSRIIRKRWFLHLLKADTEILRTSLEWQDKNTLREELHMDSDLPDLVVFIHKQNTGVWWVLFWILSVENSPYQPLFSLYMKNSEY